MAGNWAVGEPRPSARFRLLYCKMRCVHEANFIAYRRGIGSRPLPAAVLCTQISLCSRRHGALRAVGDELAAAPCLRGHRGWRAGADGFADARFSGVSGGYFCDYATSRGRCAALRQAGASCGGFGRLSGDGWAGRFAGLVAAGPEKREARFCRDAVVGGALPFYGKLHGGSDDRGVGGVSYGGGFAGAGGSDWGGVGWKSLVR